MDNEDLLNRLAGAKGECVEWIGQVAANGAVSGAAAERVRQLFDGLSEAASALRSSGEAVAFTKDNGPGKVVGLEWNPSYPVHVLRRRIPLYLHPATPEQPGSAVQGEAVGWFAYDGESNFEQYDSLDGARQWAQDSLDACSEEAPDGWPERTQWICYGSILGAVKQSGRRPATADDAGFPNYRTYVEYALTDATPPPAASQGSAVQGEVVAWRVTDENGVPRLVPATRDDRWLDEYRSTPGCTVTPLYTTPPPAPAAEQGGPVEMSPEFTDSARAALAWALYHHQGGNSTAGQAIRFALGMGEHEPLPAWRITEAKAWAERVGAKTADFHATQPEARGVDWQQRCLDLGLKYWRAPDAHGVECTHDQALELLRDLLGVEVAFTATPPADHGERIDFHTLRCWLAGIGTVGRIDGHNVIRRESMIDMLTRWIASAPAAPGAAVGVDEAMVERAYAAWSGPQSSEDDRDWLRNVLTAALAGKGGA